MCYFNSSSITRPGKYHFNISNIDPTLCTHLVYSFASPTIEGEVKSLSPNAESNGTDSYKEFNRLRTLNSNLKTLIAIGGWDDSPKVFSNLAAESEKRSTFAKNALSFVKKHGFDGMSLDWQYPNYDGKNPDDKKNHAKLVQELKERFNNTGLMLMATVAGAPSVAERSYDIPQMVKHLDSINLKAFDYHDYSEGKTGFNAPVMWGAEKDGRSVVSRTKKFKRLVILFIYA